jgi:hypothetical protein
MPISRKNPLTIRTDSGMVNNRLILKPALEKMAKSQIESIGFSGKSQVWGFKI